MKKYMILLCLFATACTNSANDTIPTAEGEENIPVTEISISKLESLNGDISVNAESIDLYSNATARMLQQRVKVTNNTDSAKALAPEVMNNSSMVLKINRCPTQLAGGKSCEILVAQIIRRAPNGTTPGFLKILDNPENFGVVINSNIEDSVYVIPTEDGSLASDIVATFSNFDDYSSGLLRKKITLTNESTSKKVMNVSYTIPSGYVIVLSRCSDVLEYKKSCDIILGFSGEAGPNVDDEFVISNGATSQALTLITKPTVSAISLAVNKKSFSITGAHFARVKSVKLVKENGDHVDNLIIKAGRSDTLIELLPSQPLNLIGGKYKFRME